MRNSIVRGASSLLLCPLKISPAGRFLPGSVVAPSRVFCTFAFATTRVCYAPMPIHSSEMRWFVEAYLISDALMTRYTEQRDAVDDDLAECIENLAAEDNIASTVKLIRRALAVANGDNVTNEDLKEAKQELDKAKEERIEAMKLQQQHDEQRERSRQVSAELRARYMPELETKQLSKSQQRKMGDRLHDVSIAHAKGSVEKLVAQYVISHDPPNVKLEPEQQREMADRLSSRK